MKMPRTRRLSPERPSLEPSRREFVHAALLGAGMAMGFPANGWARRLSSQAKPFVMDVHVHLVTPMPDPNMMTYLREMVAEIYAPWDHVYDGDGNRVRRIPISTPNATELIGMMDRWGVDVSVIMPFDIRRVAAKRQKARQVYASTNDQVAEAVRQYPDRLIGIAGHDPLRDEWKADIELERAVKELGLSSMKLYPIYHHYDPYDERLFPLYEKAVELDVPLTFHTGWTPLRSAPLRFANPESIDRVGDRYPELRANLAHAGGPSYWREAITVVARRPNFVLDISSWCGYPPRMLVELLDLARQLVGIDRILFGTEHTLCDPGHMIREVQNINTFAERYGPESFTTADIEKILGLNAARFYRWPLEGRG